MGARKQIIIHEWSGTSDAPIIRQLRTDNALYTVRGSSIYAEQINHTPPPVTHPEYRLTKKEQRVAILLARGRTNEEIARELFISSHTARHHTQAVLNKLGITSRRDVAGKLSH